MKKFLKRALLVLLILVVGVVLVIKFKLGCWILFKEILEYVFCLHFAVGRDLAVNIYFDVVIYVLDKLLGASCADGSRDMTNHIFLGIGILSTN